VWLVLHIVNLRDDLAFSHATRQWFQLAVLRRVSPREFNKQPFHSRAAVVRAFTQLLMSMQRAQRQGQVLPPVRCTLLSSLGTNADGSQSRSLPCRAPTRSLRRCGRWCGTSVTRALDRVRRGDSSARQTLCVLYSLSGPADAGGTT